MSSRDKILARRARFIAAAVSGMAIVGCSSTQAEACLSTVADTGADDARDDARKDATSDAVIDATDADTEPMPCLSAPLDTGSADTTTSTDTSTTDTGPMPCLVPPEDTGASG